MTFIWPGMLFLLVAVPLLVLLYLVLQQRRRRLAARYGGLGLVPSAAARAPGLRRHLPPALFLLALSVLIVALARPQTEMSLPGLQGTVILAFDVSGSMAATDLDPTRMQAAKTAALAFVERQPPTVQIGVVAFSDSGFAVQPPTNDAEAIFNAINRLSPERGTSLASGIAASLTALAADRGESFSVSGEVTPAPTPTDVPRGYYQPAVIVLLTDGENTVAPDPLAAAQIAANQGVRIYTVGIGSEAGADLNIEGFIVHSQLDQSMLEQISKITGGTYYNAQSTEDLKNIYQNLIPQFVIKPQEVEITSLLAGAGIVLLLIGGALSLMWFGRLP
jgi:Ca-activated chloride channel homolog